MGFIYKEDMKKLVQETMMDMLMAPVFGDSTTEAVEVAFYNEGIRVMADALIAKVKGDEPDGSTME